MHLLHIPMVIFIRHLLQIDAPALQCPSIFIPPTRVHLLIFWLQSEHYVPHSLNAVPFIWILSNSPSNCWAFAIANNVHVLIIFALHNRIQEKFL